MILAERSLAVGYWLRLRRGWLPFVIVVAAVVALFLARPFSLIHNSWMLNVFCLIISCAGIALRVFTVGQLSRESYERGDPEPEYMMWFDTTGIYSVMRHPLHTGRFLMWLGLILYVGVGWFMVGATVLYVACYEKIMIAEEDYRIRRIGEKYAEWCRTTSAVWPRLSNWMPSPYKPQILQAARVESNGILGLALSFVVIDVMKNMSYSFEFKVTPFWLAVLIAVLLFVFVVKVILRGGGNPNGGGQGAVE